ncbi:MAG: hypothetical protein AAGI68_03310 [Planctomycetota bacterium]
MATRDKNREQVPWWKRKVPGWAVAVLIVVMLLLILVPLVFVWILLDLISSLKGFG